MKIRFGVFAAIGGAVLLCSGLTVAGQQITFDNYSTIYGTYPATVGGQAANIVCDDYNDHVTIGETWNITALNVSSLNANNIDNTLFGSLIISQLPANVGTSTALQTYTELAYLVNVLVSAPPADQPLTNNPGTALITANGVAYTTQDVSEAIWNLTLPYQGGGNFGAGSGTGSENPDDLDSYVSGLVTGNNPITLSQFSNLWVYTPVPNQLGGPQEMWGTVDTPEGGASLLYLFLAGAACFGAFAFSSRKQPGNRETA
jgi:hypothetical protein